MYRFVGIFVRFDNFGNDETTPQNGARWEQVQPSARNMHSTLNSSSATSKCGGGVVVMHARYFVCRGPGGWGFNNTADEIMPDD